MGKRWLNQGCAFRRRGSYPSRDPFSRIASAEAARSKERPANRAKRSLLPAKARPASSATKKPHWPRRASVHRGTLICRVARGAGSTDSEEEATRPSGSYEGRPIMSAVRWLGWATWSAVSSGFREIEIGWNRLESVGMLPHLLPQRTRLASKPKRTEDSRISREAGAGSPPRCWKPPVSRPTPSESHGFLSLRMICSGVCRLLFTCVGPPLAHCRGPVRPLTRVGPISGGHASFVSSLRAPGPLESSGQSRLQAR